MVWNWYKGRDGTWTLSQLQNRGEKYPKMHGRDAQSFMHLHSSSPKSTRNGLLKLTISPPNQDYKAAKFLRKKIFISAPGLRHDITSCFRISLPVFSRYHECRSANCTKQVWRHWPRGSILNVGHTSGKWTSNLWATASDCYPKVETKTLELDFVCQAFLLQKCSLMFDQQ